MKKFTDSKRTRHVYLKNEMTVNCLQSLALDVCAFQIERKGEKKNERETRDEEIMIT